MRCSSSSCSVALVAWGALLIGCASRTVDTAQESLAQAPAHEPIITEQTPEHEQLLSAEPEAIRTIAAQVAREPRAGNQASQDLSLYGEFNMDDMHFGEPFAGSSENLSQVSFSREGSDFDPVVSRDGAHIYFASTAHSPSSDIFVKAVHGTALTQLTTDPANDMMPAVSPDGSRVAFASNRSGSWDVFVMSASGGQAVQITSDIAQELHPTWSPDGRHIAFCRLNPNSDRWEIWVTDAESGAMRRFLTYGLFPEWHPFENKIAFQRSRERGDRFFSVWTVDYSDGEAISPTIIASSNQAAILNPKWSHDGNYMAIAAIGAPNEAAPGQRPTRSDIWIMRADGGARANITGGQHVNLMPCWGPGNSIFFVSDRSGRDNIWASSTEQAMLAAGFDLPQHTPGSRGQHSSQVADAPTDITDRD